MAIVTRNEGAKINSSINVTPMVDVMLVLLIIFMVITPMLRPAGAPVDLARTSNAMQMSGAGKPDALIVSVMRDGKIFLGSESVTSQTLTQKLQDKLSARINKTVYVRADARARYGVLAGAVDDVRSAGADQLGLLTEQKGRVIVP
jgi:biopolymer transport protein ExbD/biopolymer transport protein TolR